MQGTLLLIKLILAFNIKKKKKKEEKGNNIVNIKLKFFDVKTVTIVQYKNLSKPSLFG